MLGKNNLSPFKFYIHVFIWLDKPLGIDNLLLEEKEKAFEKPHIITSFVEENEKALCA